MSLKILFHKVVKVKIQVLKFSKWKFEVKHFRSIETLAWLIEMVKKKSWSLWMVRSLFDSFSIDWMLFSIERTPQSIETQKLNFLLNFSGDCSEMLKRFQVLWTVLWNILTLYTCLLMKNNPMGINRGLCSLEK